jgi:hypothetical protein
MVELSPHMRNLSIYMDPIEKINSLGMGEKKAPAPKGGAFESG